jgi:hypothetical protein
VINSFFNAIGFLRSLSDLALYIFHVHEANQLLLLITIYVDDIIIIGKSIAKIDRIKDKLHQKFDITDLGEIKTLLGMEIVRFQDGSVFLHQDQYLTDLL